MSADSNAIIYARGETDLVGLAIMQAVHGIRKDILLKYYETELFADKSRPVYLCLSLGKKVLEQYPGAIYTGLLVKLGADASGAVDELRGHFQHDMNLDYIQNKSFSKELAQLHNNYLPALALLYKSYQQDHPEEARRWLKMMEKIAEEGGKKDLIKQIIE
jgi:hypothetical protein